MDRAIKSWRVALRVSDAARWSTMRAIESPAAPRKSVTLSRSHRIALGLTLAAGLLAGLTAGGCGGPDAETAGGGGTNAACNHCHGSDENPAPPRSTTGATDTGDMAVGAHQAHLHDSAVRQGMWCQECHLVPTTPDDPSHRDGLPAELTFGVLAVSSGAKPSFNHESGACTEVYCHGATLRGGAKQSPIWTAVDGSQAFCGSCHGIPPLPPHPASHECGSCHPGAINDIGGIDVSGGLHINGKIDVGGMACDSCHGSTDNFAPPVSTTGATATTDIAVGAHQSHVVASTLAAAIACDACHLVPAAIDDEGHIDAAPAEVTFGATAVQDGATPSWDRGSATCSQTYCHGATLSGGSLGSPVWVTVDGTQAACGTCHGLPPTANHQPTSDFCPMCHTQVTEGQPGSVTIKNPALHVDGQVEF